MTVSPWSIKKWKIFWMFRVLHSKCVPKMFRRKMIKIESDYEHSHIFSWFLFWDGKFVFHKLSKNDYQDRKTCFMVFEAQTNLLTSSSTGILQSTARTKTLTSRGDFLPCSDFICSFIYCILWLTPGLSALRSSHSIFVSSCCESKVTKTNS